MDFIAQIDRWQRRIRGISRAHQRRNQESINPNHYEMLNGTDEDVILKTLQLRSP
jgi:hypothetical protein